MPNARLAEFLLRRATIPERASAIAGDLLEQYPHQPLHLAISVTRVMLALQWKQLLGFVAALFFFLPYAFPLGIMFLLRLPRTMGLHEVGILENVSRLIFVCLVLLAVSAFAFTKTSTRRVATMSLILALTSFSAASYALLNQDSGRSPQVATLIVALILIAVPTSRRASFISLATSAVILLTPLMIWEVSTVLVNRQNDSIVFSLNILTWLTAIAAGAATLNALQHRFNSPAVA